MINIEYLKDCIGSNKFGTCSSCLKGSGEDKNMVRITFSAQNGKHISGTSVCLCDECKRLLVGRVIVCQ